MNLNDLNKSISDMTDAELEKHIINVRKKINTKKLKIKVSKSATKPKSPISKMTKAEKEKLIAELEAFDD